MTMGLLKTLCIVFITISNFQSTDSHPAYVAIKKSNSQNLFSKDFTTNWPLKEIFQKMELTNLDDIVSVFQPCLTNMQNFHGINIAPLSSPVYLTRYDIFNIATKDEPKRTSDIFSFLFLGSNKKIYKVPFEKVPFHLKNKTAKLPAQFMNVEDRSAKARWKCFVQIDLFYPEVHDAFHFYLHQMEHGPVETNIFGFKVRHAKPDSLYNEESDCK